jgi:hypothetical protein
MKKTIGAAILVGSLAIAAGAHAQTFDQTHPRRAEVNGRLANQNARITQGVRDGQLSHAQAHQLRADDHAMRAEERADASVNGGHITRGEQRQINAQENANSRAIYGERHY